MATWSSPMFARRKYSVFRTHVDQHACKQVGRVVYDQSKCPAGAFPFLPSFLMQHTMEKSGSSCAHWVWDKSPPPKLSISLASSVWIYCKRGVNILISFSTGHLLTSMVGFNQKTKTLIWPRRDRIIHHVVLLIFFDHFLSSICICLVFIVSFHITDRWLFLILSSVYYNRHADPILIVLTRPDVPLLGVVMRTRLLAADIRLISKWESNAPV